MSALFKFAAGDLVVWRHGLDGVTFAGVVLRALDGAYNLAVTHRWPGGRLRVARDWSVPAHDLEGCAHLTDMDTLEAAENAA